MRSSRRIISAGFVCRRNSTRTMTVSQFEPSSHLHSRTCRQPHLRTIINTLASPLTAISDDFSSTRTPLAPTIDQLTTNSFALIRASTSAVDLSYLETAQNTLHYCNTEAQTSQYTFRVLDTYFGAGVRLRARDGCRSLVLRDIENTNETPHTLHKI